MSKKQEVLCVIWVNLSRDLCIPSTDPVINGISFVDELSAIKLISQRILSAIGKDAYFCPKTVSRCLIPLILSSKDRDEVVNAVTSCDVTFEIFPTFLVEPFFETFSTKTYFWCRFKNGYSCVICQETLCLDLTCQFIKFWVQDNQCQLLLLLLHNFSPMVLLFAELLASYLPSTFLNISFWQLCCTWLGIVQHA